MQFIDSQKLKQLLKYEPLIARLSNTFEAGKVHVPLRHHHSINGKNTLLLMPAWQNDRFGGVKIVTVSPENKDLHLPSIAGIYYLFDAKTGMPLCTMDAATLTNLRTASSSALASQYLSGTDSSVLLMIGTGSLAPYLIQAHCAVRPIKKVLIYGRSFDKARALCHNLGKERFECIPVQSIEEGMKQANIISCATLSHEPIISGRWAKPGQHIDLVGSFKPDMREADDLLIAKCSLYADTIEGASKESGDISIPIDKGLIDLKDIKGDLFGLCSGRISGRKSDTEITCFKSVGHALEDLVAAELVYELAN